MDKCLNHEGTLLLTIHIYTDGSCIGNPGPGGWGVAVRPIVGIKHPSHAWREMVDNYEFMVWDGEEEETTNTRMEMMAALQGLLATPSGAEVIIYSDSSLLVNTMTRNYKRNANTDLWNQLDVAKMQRKVSWEKVPGHAGHPENELVDRVANQAAQRVVGRLGKGDRSDKKSTASNRLTHFDEQGRARQVDVSKKEVTFREAIARGAVVMHSETLGLIEAGQVEKGNVLEVARLAAIGGAKLTPQLIPLTHAIPLDQVELEFSFDKEASSVRIEAMARATARTGVEMEAITAVVTAALTIYDMCKAVDRQMWIQDIRLVRKTGGSSGDLFFED